MTAAPDDTPPEVNFKFRRILAYLWTLVNSVFVGAIILKVDEPIVLQWIALALILSNGFMALLYMAGASAVDVGQILHQIAKIKSPSSSEDK